VLTMAKKAILGGMGLSLREGLKHSMNIFLNELYRLEDSQEGLRALVEKRKPNWKKPLNGRRVSQSFQVQPDRFQCIDTRSDPGLHSIFNLQAREAGRPCDSAAVPPL